MPKKVRTAVHVNPDFSQPASVASIAKPAPKPVVKKFTAPKRPTDPFEALFEGFRARIMKMPFGDALALLNGNPLASTVERLRRAPSDIEALEKRILDVLSSSETPMKSGDISLATGASKAEIASPLQRLLAKKEVRRTGSKNTTTYSVA